MRELTRKRIYVNQYYTTTLGYNITTARNNNVNNMNIAWVLLPTGIMTCVIQI